MKRTNHKPLPCSPWCLQTSSRHVNVVLVDFALEGKLLTWQIWTWNYYLTKHTRTHTIYIIFSITVHLLSDTVAALWDLNHSMKNKTYKKCLISLFLSLKFLAGVSVGLKKEILLFAHPDISHMRWLLLIFCHGFLALCKRGAFRCY